MRTVQEVPKDTIYQIETRIDQTDVKISVKDNGSEYSLDVYTIDEIADSEVYADEPLYSTNLDEEPTEREAELEAMNLFAEDNPGAFGLSQERLEENK